jgi:hypothetical protein
MVAKNLQFDVVLFQRKKPLYPAPAITILALFCGAALLLNVEYIQPIGLVLGILSVVP